MIEGVRARMPRAAGIVRLGRARLSGAWDQCAFVNDVLAALDRAR